MGVVGGGPACVDRSRVIMLYGGRWVRIAPVQDDRPRTMAFFHPMLVVEVAG